MAAYVVFHPICPDHHRKCVPANQTLYPPFHIMIAGKRGLPACRNCVYVGSVGGKWQVNSEISGPLMEFPENFVRDRLAALSQRGVKGLDPFPEL